MSHHLSFHVTPLAISAKALRASCVGCAGCAGVLKRKGRILVEVTREREVLAHLTLTVELLNGVAVTNRTSTFTHDCPSSLANSKKELS